MMFYLQIKRLLTALINTSLVKPVADRFIQFIDVISHMSSFIVLINVK